MRMPVGITLGNLFSAAVTVVVVAAGVYAQWVLVSYRMDETAQRLDVLETHAHAVDVAIGDIRLTYATAGSLHDLQADQRATLAPLQAKIDQLIDRIAAVDRNQVETSTGLKALAGSVADLKRMLIGRQPTAYHETAGVHSQPP